MDNFQSKINPATELWQGETNLPCIPTFSQNLDHVLGNEGVQLNSITEFIGLPGSGKTQLCLQICASVQIPKTLGGLDAEALYIDTNMNFTISRFREILQASLTKCQTLLGPPFHVNVDEALKRLHYVNAFGLDKFCATMHTLPNYITENPNIRLVVIDSIVFPFKTDISVQQRTGLLFRQMADLQRMAVEKQIAIVLTNEMSTRLGLSSGGTVVGALGDAWSHRCNKRVLLSEPRQFIGFRLAALIKSNNSQNNVGRFQITHEGIRDAE